jgi:hypothetical protein
MGASGWNRNNLLARAGPVNIQRHTVGGSIQQRLSLPEPRITSRRPAEPGYQYEP